jgi:hypothetical protein
MAKSRRRVARDEYATEMVQWCDDARRVYQELRDLAHVVAPDRVPALNVAPDRVPDLTMLAWRLEWLERQARLLLRGALGPAPPVGPHDDRDRLCYERTMEGHTYGAILREVKGLAQDRGWTPIGTEGGVSHVAHDYALRNSLPPPPPRKPGRRKATQGESEA